MHRLAVLVGGVVLGVAAAVAWAQDQSPARPTQDELLRFQPFGQVTLVHVTDLHAQLVPMHFREATTNIGVGEARG